MWQKKSYGPRKLELNAIVNFAYATLTMASVAEWVYEKVSDLAGSSNVGLDESLVHAHTRFFKILWGVGGF